MRFDLDRVFQRCLSDDPSVPVWCTTAPLGRCIHRFFDTSPISPSGRFVAVTRLPYEDRPTAPGDPAEIVVVDHSDGSGRTVSRSSAWGMQLGAQVQWGRDDRYLFFNDLVPGEWKPFGVRLDLSSGERFRMRGTVYSLSPDGRFAASPCLRRTERTQPGYGAVVPQAFLPKNVGAQDDDGLYLTDTLSGESRLLASFRRIVEETGLETKGPGLAQSAYYGFHAKWNADGSRLMFVIRKTPLADPTRRQSNVLTMNSDGSNIRIALHWRDWARGGHHPNWHPDGQRITMNLRDQEGVMRFVRFNYDGNERTTLGENLRGSGHPSLHRSGRYLLSDAYGRERLGSRMAHNSPIRLIDLQAQSERRFFEFDGRPPDDRLRELRIDAHPAWSRDNAWIAFNGRSGGTRNVFLADLSQATAAI